MTVEMMANGHQGMGLMNDGSCHCIWFSLHHSWMRCSAAVIEPAGNVASHGVTRM